LAKPSHGILDVSLPPNGGAWTRLVTWLTDVVLALPLVYSLVLVIRIVLAPRVLVARTIVTISRPVF
jgi:hypothetical protein